MCVVSYVGDDFGRSLPVNWPQTYTYITHGEVSRGEHEALKQELAELRSKFDNLVKLLKLAKIVDGAAGTPDCEMDDKVDLIKRLAELLDVDLEGILG